MTIETGLVSRVTPICTDIFPGIAPNQPPLPCVVYNRVEMTPSEDLSPGTTEAWVLLQVDTYSLRYLDARAMADAIRPVLEAWVDDDIQAVSWKVETEDMDTTTTQNIYTVKQRFSVLVNL